MNLPEIIRTKNYGAARVLGEGRKYKYVRVQFLNTGHCDEFREDAVRKGEIRDKYAVTLFGVGIIGNIKTRGKNHKLYQVWRNMLHRCYHKVPSSYKNVTVCERWHTFEYFHTDVTSIEGWDEELFQRGELVLDKDLKQRFSPHKEYSVTTCRWVSPKTNSKIQDSQQRCFCAVSPSGEKFYSTNITEFARLHGLERRGISSVLHQRIKTTLGWTFSYVDNCQCSL